MRCWRWYRDGRDTGVEWVSEYRSSVESACAAGRCWPRGMGLRWQSGRHGWSSDGHVRAMMVCRGRRPVKLAGLLSVNAEMVDRRQCVEKREGDDGGERAER